MGLINIIFSNCLLIDWLQIPHGHLFIVIIDMSWTSKQLELHVQVFDYLSHIFLVLILLQEAFVSSILNENAFFIKYKVNITGAPWKLLRVQNRCDFVVVYQRELQDCLAQLHLE